MFRCLLKNLLLFIPNDGIGNKNYFDKNPFGQSMELFVEEDEGSYLSK